jgi:hypothetical protein
MAAGRVVFGYDNSRPDIIPDPYTNIHTHQVNRVKKWTRTHRVSVGYRVSGGYATVKYKSAYKIYPYPPARRRSSGRERGSGRAMDGATRGWTGATRGWCRRAAWASGMVQAQLGDGAGRSSRTTDGDAERCKPGAQLGGLAAQLGAGGTARAGQCLRCWWAAAGARRGAGGWELGSGN